MNNQVKLIDIDDIEKTLHKTWSLNKMEAKRYQRKIRDNSYEWLMDLVKEVRMLREENSRLKQVSQPVPTIKPGDKVRHVSIGTHGLAVETSDVGVFVHWSTGQRSWYPYASLEVVE